MAWALVVGFDFRIVARPGGGCAGGLEVKMRRKEKCINRILTLALWEARRHGYTCLDLQSTEDAVRRLRRMNLKELRGMETRMQKGEDNGTN